MEECSDRVQNLSLWVGALARARAEWRAISSHCTRYGFECAEAVSDWLTKVLACEHAWQRADEAAEQQTKVDHRKGAENRKGKSQSM